MLRLAQTNTKTTRYAMFFTHTTYDVIRNALRKQTVDEKISKEITPETTRNPRL